MKLPLFLPAAVALDGATAREPWGNFWVPRRHTVIAVLPSTHTPV